MSVQERRITNVKLRASHDPGHGGSSYYYKIDADEGTYLVSLEISGSFPRTMPLPRPGERYPDLPYIKEVLVKDNQQVQEFLRKLSVEFDVFELNNLKTPHWLHPTSYTFSFRDSLGTEHIFEYLIDCSNHLDERYNRLIKAFDDFFEQKTIAMKFVEQAERQKSLIHERAKNRWWKFW